MKNVKRLGVSFCLVLVFTSLAFAAGPSLTDAMKVKLQKDIKAFEEWVVSPLVMDAVKLQNEQNFSLEEIKKRDTAWNEIIKSRSKPNDLMTALYNHEFGAWVRRQNKEAKGRYPEAFLTDNQGANVAVSKLTSDYWQGDEGKWIDSFAEGKGQVLIGEPEFDESTKAMQVQISIPVMDQGQAIGVLVVGVKFRHLK